MTGIRLADGAPIPPVPSLGSYRPVTAAGLYLGAVVETDIEVHVPVCAHPDHRAALDPCTDETIAIGDLYRHWNTTHPGDAA